MPPLGEHPHVGNGWGISFPSVLLAGYSHGNHLAAKGSVCKAKTFVYLYVGNRV